MAVSHNINIDSYLFGGPIEWDTSQWTASDDSVRGGKSQSHLTVLDAKSPATALFHGHLDITALGGAGFASQRTVETEKTWNLEGGDGLMIKIAPFIQHGSRISHQSDQGAREKADKCKRFTLVIKDTILPSDPNTGREQSTTSWEGDFEIDEIETSPKEVVFGWKDLKPFYRGKQIPDDKVDPLKVDAIKRFSIMVRSHFGEQRGDFELEILWIAAVNFDKLGNEEKAGSDPRNASRASERTAWTQRFLHWACF